MKNRLLRRAKLAATPRPLAWALLAAGVCGWLAACSTPGGALPTGRSSGPTVVPQPAMPGADGPPEGPVPDARLVADAEPRIEPIRGGGANKPYEVLGQAYVPSISDEPVVERGLASWYGRKFHGRRTASGETYNMLAMTAAHRTMPIPSYARVRNPANGREVIVRVNDRGPFSSRRIIDLSYTAADKLGILNGVTMVEVERITNEEIRAGLTKGLSPQPPVPPILLASAVTTRALPGGASNSVAGVPATTLPAMPAMPAMSAMPAVAAAEPFQPTATATATPEPPLAVAQLPGPTPDRARAYTPAATGFWLQLGAFGRGDGAYSFQQRVAQELAWLSPLLTVFADGGLHRLQAGPYGSRDQAREAAERVRGALQLVPVIVERR